MSFGAGLFKHVTLIKRAIYSIQENAVYQITHLKYRTGCMSIRKVLVGMETYIPPFPHNFFVIIEPNKCMEVTKSRGFISDGRLKVIRILHYNMTV